MHISLLPAFTISIACLAAAPAVTADEPEGGIEELESLLALPVYGASKYRQTVADAPASVTIITQGEIRAFGWRTLADVLNAIRGVHIRSDRAYSYVGVRGLGRPGDYSSRLLMLVDGVRLNDNIYDSVLIGREFPLDIDLIERIEFIPGPGSAVHGGNAVLGTINLVTRSAASLRGPQAAAAFDTQQGWKLGASTTSEHAHGALLVAGNVELRPGQTLAFPEFDSPAFPGGVVRGMDGESAGRLFVRFAAEDWSATALAGRRAKEIPNAPFGMVFGDRAAEWVDSIGLLGLSWHPRPVNGEGWYAQAGLGRYEYGDHGRYEPDGVLMRYQNHGLWAYGELNHTLRMGERQLLLLGTAVQQDLQQDVSSSVLEPVPEPEAKVGTQGTRLGFYASDDIKLSAQWQLGLGGRLDRNRDANWSATPRLSLLWKPTETLVLKALAGKAYREPNVYERAPEDFSTEWNNDLRRERTRARELAADWQPAASLRVSASAYRYDIKDMIEQVVVPDADGLAYANVSSARAHGLELETEYRANWGLRVRSSLSRQTAKNDAGDILSNSPRWLAKLHATAPLPVSSLRAAVELQGMGERLTEAGAELSAQWLANASLGWNPAGRPWSLSLTVHNVFNRRVDDPTSVEYLSDRVAQDGREATLRLFVKF
ncbi:MAG: TonB-dependent receptor [Pseudomonadota bacterium]|nr:TonB-dependent receptor [Pseudomonadota bacterium]